MEEVTVNWQLLDEEGNTAKQGSTITDNGGAFEIEINEILDFKNDKRYPLKIEFSKLTVSGNSTVPHKFLCNQETKPCTADQDDPFSDAGLLYLRHLDFDVPYHAIDDTTVPFTGKIMVADTGGPTSGAGCPIAGAEVCLRDVKAGRSGASTMSNCVETDSTGQYQLSAVIGTRVRPEVKYLNHTFVSYHTGIHVNKSLFFLTKCMLQEPVKSYEDGIFVSAGRRYFGYDFFDTQTTNLDVDVIGGLCEKGLGTSFISINVLGCEWKQEFNQVCVI